MDLKQSSGLQYTASNKSQELAVHFTCLTSLVNFCALINKTECLHVTMVLLQYMLSTNTIVEPKYLENIKIPDGVESFCSLQINRYSPEVFLYNIWLCLLEHVGP